jgi:hypothetical protein
MNDLVNELTKPVWWVSVVVVGILVNLASAYFKSILDRSLTTTTRWWQLRSSARRKAWENYVNLLKTSQEALNQARYLELRARLQAIFFLICATVFFLIDFFVRASEQKFSLFLTIFPLASAALFFVVAYRYLIDAIKKGEAIHEAIPENS